MSSDNRKDNNKAWDDLNKKISKTHEQFEVATKIGIGLVLTSFLATGYYLTREEKPAKNVSIVQSDSAKLIDSARTMNRKLKY